MDESSEKAYYNRAMAHMATKGFEEAMKDLKSCIWMKPNDKGLRDLFAKAKSSKAEEDKKAKKQFVSVMSESLYTEKEGKPDPVFYDMLPEFNPKNA